MNTPLPPHAPDAEMAVLGAMMVEADATEHALEMLRPDDFYSPIHRTIFQAAETVYRSQKAVDAVTMTEELRRVGKLDEIGGTAFLASLIDKVTTAAHVEHFVRIVHDKSVLRSLIRAATGIVRDCYAEKETAILLDESQAEIMNVAQRQTSNSFADADSMMHAAVTRIEQMYKTRSAVTGVPTGFKSLDRMTTGLHPGQLILLAGRPGHGKTSLAMNIAANVLFKDAGGVAFFSLEMDHADLANRLVACEAGANLQDIRRGYLKRDAWQDITNAAARIAGTPLFVDDSANLSVLEVRGRVRRLSNDLRKKGKKLSLIIIDYLQLMRGASRRAENRQQEVSEISRGLKLLARDLRVPVIALSQLSRRVEDKARSDGRPQLSDLRDSGSLEQDADVVAFIFREAASRPHDPSLDQKKAEIILAKQRQGPTGVIPVFFDPDKTRFRDLDPVADEPWQETQENFT